MPTYEITLHYPDRPYDENRRFLGSVAGSFPSGLDGFKRQGTGVALTFVVRGHYEREMAVRMANQRAAGLWPNYYPSETVVVVLD